MRHDPDRARELFQAALDLEPDEVARLLDGACAGDPALRSAVNALLSFRGAVDQLADTSPGALPTLTDPHEIRSADPRGSRRPARYRELAELGTGGCGRVTRVYDRNLGRIVAHKGLHTPREDLRRMLVQEARLLAYLDHPGTVQVLDGDVDHYTMRLLEGETLQQRMRRGPVPLGECVRVLTRVAETMANAHAKGVLHLDLKPANILVQPYGQVSVIDWGLARFHDPDAYTTYLRAAGDEHPPAAADWSGAGGTPAYMPVEQALGLPLTPAADVFAFGTILYELISGELPFPPGPLPGAVLAKKVTRPRPLAAHRADVPPRLDELCLRMLAPEPRDRPAGFAEVLAEWSAWWSGEGDAEILALAPGEVLFREGDEGASAFQILSGAVEVSVRGPGGPTVLARRAVGELVGELAIVSRAPRSATVTAVEPTRVAVVTAAVIEHELARANPLVAQMLRSLSDRLRETVERARGTG